MSNLSDPHDTQQARKIYLNTASCGLINKEHLRSTYDLYEAMTTDSSSAAEQLRESGLQRIRETVASFIGASPANLAFIPNFSYGLNALVQSLRGDEKVLLYKNDYPSLLEPFRINKFDITWIDAKDEFTIDLKELKNSLIKERIGLLAISHVQWLSGYKMDLAELGFFCKEHNIIFIVDATQSLGAVPVDISTLHIDVLISSNYKWMNAGFGTGIMYMSDSFLDKYEPVIGGNNSYIFIDGLPTYVPSIRSYEPGHLNFHGLLILEAAVNEKLRLGIASIEDHNTKLLNLLFEGLDESVILGPASIDGRSSIVMVRDQPGLYERLAAAGIVVIKRGENIRIGVHYYNTEEEVQALLACINIEHASLSPDHHTEGATER